MSNTQSFFTFLIFLILFELNHVDNAINYSRSTSRPLQEHICAWEWTVNLLQHQLQFQHFGSNEFPLIRISVVSLKVLIDSMIASAQVLKSLAKQTDLAALLQ